MLKPQSLFVGFQGSAGPLQEDRVTKQQLADRRGEKREGETRVEGLNKNIQSPPSERERGIVLKLLYV